MRIIDTSLKDISDLQQRIMVIISDWAHTQRVPIPRRVIVSALQKEGVKEFSVKDALNALDRKGYIRRAVIVSNSTSYVQLRGV